MDVAGQHEPDGDRAASQKSPDAFRTISEVSSDLDVPQHVLRFWEGKFAQIKPLKRGGGRRYYRPEDVDLLRGIQHLLYGDGYTIKGVQKLLRENGVKHVVAAGRREHQTARAKTKLTPVAEAPTPNLSSPVNEAASAVRHEDIGGGGAAPAPLVEPPAHVPAPPPRPLDNGSLGGAPLFARQHAAPEIRNDPAPSFSPPPAPVAAPEPEPAPEPEIHAAPEPELDDHAEARRIEVAAKLLARLKALRRDYDIRLQAAKNGR
ncbi:MAG: MerR family transcriptional regulator [Micropepsaceae bacterium]